MKVEAGRELDAEVAEKVMGWTLVTESCMEGRPHYAEHDSCCPEFSSHLGSAWTVYKHVGRLMRLEDYGPYGWACEFLAVQPGQEDVIVKAETAPLAICLAALLVVEAREKTR